jgi:hypothetical protein
MDVYFSKDKINMWSRKKLDCPYNEKKKKKLKCESLNWNKYVAVQNNNGYWISSRSMIDPYGINLSHDEYLK